MNEQAIEIIGVKARTTAALTSLGVIAALPIAIYEDVSRRRGGHDIGAGRSNTEAAARAGRSVSASAGAIFIERQLDRGRRFSDCRNPQRFFTK
jgi:hypothetical protein